MSLISLVNVIMERIFESKGEKLVSSFKFKSYSTNNSFIGSPAAWYATSGVEESWANLFDFKIFFESSLFHVPSNNFNNIIRLVSNLNLVETISIPVVTLSDIAAIEIVLCIVVVTKIICRIDERISHLQSYIKFIELRYSLQIYITELKKIVKCLSKYFCNNIRKIRYTCSNHMIVQQVFFVDFPA